MLWHLSPGTDRISLFFFTLSIFLIVQLRLQWQWSQHLWTAHSSSLTHRQSVHHHHAELSDKLLLCPDTLTNVLMHETASVPLMFTNRSLNSCVGLVFIVTDVLMMFSVQCWNDRSRRYHCHQRSTHPHHTGSKWRCPEQHCTICSGQTERWGCDANYCSWIDRLMNSSLFKSEPIWDQDYEPQVEGLFRTYPCRSPDFIYPVVQGPDLQRF